MKDIKQISSFAIGLAVFSMFFGSGNLVFPLFLGQLAKESWASTALGFLLTGVIGPFLGVITMVLYKGSTDKFFSTLPSKLALAFMIILTLVWIPLGAGPRCMNVTYDTLLFFTPSCPKWIFILVYSSIVAIVIQKSSKMLQILGYVLTPCLLVFLALLWGLGIWDAPKMEQAAHSHTELFYQGILYGYNSLDFIAGFFYSSALIYTLRQTKMSDKTVLKKTFFAGSVGMLFLAIVYLSFIYLAARHAEAFASVNMSQFIGFLSLHLLGKSLSIIPSIAVALACLTTSIAMTSFFSQFLYDRFFHARKNGGMIAKSISIASTMVVSLFGLEELLYFVTPILEVSCHVLFLLTVFNLLTRHYKKKDKSSMESVSLPELEEGN